MTGSRVWLVEAQNRSFYAKFAVVAENETARDALVWSYLAECAAAEADACGGSRGEFSYALGGMREILAGEIGDPGGLFRFLAGSADPTPMTYQDLGPGVTLIQSGRTANASPRLAMAEDRCQTPS